MKEKIKKIPLFRKTFLRIKQFLSISEYLHDYNHFIHNYMYSNDSSSKLSYRALLLVHSIEKGMTNDKIRPFGKYKIFELMSILKELEKRKENNIFSYIISVNLLREYNRIYIENGWNTNEYEEFVKVEKFLSRQKKIDNINIMPQRINNTDIKNHYNINYEDFVNSRHSTRTYKNKNINRNDLEYCVRCAIKSPSACNRQMCKIYYIENKDLKDLITKNRQGFNNFDIKSANIFLVTFNTSAFSFIGERNQGYFNAGLFTMNFCNALHSKGIGSCCVQFGSKFKLEKKLKKQIGISNAERIAVIISAGYYSDQFTVPASIRKSNSDILIFK